MDRLLERQNEKRSANTTPPSSLGRIVKGTADFLRNAYQSVTAPAQKNPQRRRFRPLGLEQLEDRALMSADPLDAFTPLYNYESDQAYVSTMYPGMSVATTQQINPQSIEAPTILEKSAYFYLTNDAGKIGVYTKDMPPGTMIEMDGRKLAPVHDAYVDLGSYSSQSVVRLINSEAGFSTVLAQNIPVGSSFNTYRNVTVRYAAEGSPNNNVPLGGFLSATSEPSYEIKQQSAYFYVMNDGGRIGVYTRDMPAGTMIEMDGRKLAPVHDGYVNMGLYSSQSVVRVTNEKAGFSQILAENIPTGSSFTHYSNIQVSYATEKVSTPESSSPTQTPPTSSTETSQTEMMRQARFYINVEGTRLGVHTMDMPAGYLIEVDGIRKLAVHDNYQYFDRFGSNSEVRLIDPAGTKVAVLNEGISLTNGLIHHGPIMVSEGPFTKQSTSESTTAPNIVYQQARFYITTDGGRLSIHTTNMPKGFSIDVDGQRKPTVHDQYVYYDRYANTSKIRLLDENGNQVAVLANGIPSGQYIKTDAISVPVTVRENPIVPSITYVASTGPHLLVNVQSPFDRSTVYFGNQLFRYDDLRHEGGTAGTMGTISLDPKLPAGTYTIQLIAFRGGTALDTLKVRWDPTTKTITPVSTGDQWSVDGAMKTYVQSGLFGVTGEANHDGATAISSAREMSLEAYKYLDALKKNSALKSIDLTGTTMAPMQGSYLHNSLPKDSPLVMQKTVDEIVRAVRPDLYPVPDDQLEAYLRQRVAYLPANEQAQQLEYLRETFERERTYTRRVIESSLANGYYPAVYQILEASVQAAIDVRQGIITEQQAIAKLDAKCVSVLQNRTFAEGLAMAQIKLPSGGTLLYNGADLLNRGLDRLVALQMAAQKTTVTPEDAARMEAQRIQTETVGKQTASLIAMARSGQTMTAEDRESYARALRLAKDAIAASNDSRVIAYLNTVGGKQVAVDRIQQAIIALGNTSQNPNSSIVAMEATLKVVSNSLLGTAEETEWMQIVQNRSAEVTNAELEKFLTGLSDVQKQTFFREIGVKIDNAVLVASAGTTNWSGQAVTDIAATLRKWNANVVNGGQDLANKMLQSFWSGAQAMNELSGQALKDALQVSAKGTVTVTPKIHLPTQVYLQLKTAQLNSHIENAANRGGAVTQEQIKTYHQKLITDDTFKLSPQFELNNGARPLLVVVLGNKQSVEDASGDAGLKNIFDHYSQTHNVVIFRVGRAWEEIKTATNASLDFSEHSSVIQKHFENVLSDIINGKGLFANRSKPTNITFVGYSFGAGAIQELLEKWSTIGQGIKIGGTAFIDGVQLGIKNYGDGINAKPSVSPNHLHIWQNSESLTQYFGGSAPVHGTGLGNTLIDKGTYREKISSDATIREIFVESTNHTLIDELPEVQNWTKDFISSSLLK